MIKWMGSAANSIQVAGAVINRVAMDFPADGTGMITFGFLGEDDAAPASSALAVSPVLVDTALRTNDCTLTWGGTEIDVISFNLEMTNNAFHVFTEDQTPDAILLGPFELTGSITGEWVDTGITNSMAADSRVGTDSAVVLTWGSAGFDGYYNLLFDARIVPTPAQTEADNFQQVTFNLEGVDGGSTWAQTTNTSVAFNNLIT
jgi:hypothetical protein